MKSYYNLVKVAIIALICLCFIFSTALKAVSDGGRHRDTTPPAAVTDLVTGTVTENSVNLTWTAPGDDGNEGTATSYDIRYSTAQITEANWASATQVTGEPAPLVAGSSQSFTVIGLNCNTTYYFALKTSDEVPNTSDISNSPNAITSVCDTTPPAAITDLATTGRVGSDSVELSWTAPGDDGSVGRASSYDVRYAKTPIANDAEFSAASQATGEPAPATAGTTEYFTVTGSESNTIYYFAIKSKDEALNTSGLSTTSPSGKTGLLSGWNMVSCPLQPSPNESNLVFGDDAGLNWMFYWYSTWTGVGDPNDAGYYGDEYGQAYPPYRAPTIVPGRGIFLYSLKDYDPTDASGTDITDASYTLSLSPGWNLIGNPYGTSVSLSNCNVYNPGAPEPKTRTYADAVTAGWIGNAVYIWNGSTYVSYVWDVAKLEPWKGYWIMAYQDLDLIINKP